MSSVELCIGADLGYGVAVFGRNTSNSVPPMCALLLTFLCPYSHPAGEKVDDCNGATPDSNGFIKTATYVCVPVGDDFCKFGYRTTVCRQKNGQCDKAENCEFAFTDLAACNTRCLLGWWCLIPHTSLSVMTGLCWDADGMLGFRHDLQSCRL
jgi:hypothetical protein